MINKITKLYKVRTIRSLLQILLIAAIALSLVGLQTPKQVLATTVVNLTSTGETYLRQGYPTKNNGGAVTVSVSNGTSKQNSLYKWNLSTIPPGSTVTAASITFYVTDGSSADFSLFSMRRAWVEGTSIDTESSTSANYNTYDGSNSWGTAGAMNTSSDRYNTDLWDATGGSSGTFSTLGIVTIPLNTSGITAVQGWVNDSSGNFGVTMQFTGTAGTADYWIVASKENTSSYTVPTLNVTYEEVGPTITTSTGALNPFNTPTGTASAAQTYAVSGVNLTENIVITAPAGFEVSLDNAAWDATKTLTPSAGTVSSTTIYVHMPGTSEGSFSGNITHTSAGASQKDVSVSGIVAQYYALSVTAGTGGSVTLNPLGGSYPTGTDVTLTAVPDSGYAFSNWSGDLESSLNPATLTMNGNKSVTANFTVSLCTTVNLVTAGDTRIRSSSATTNYGSETTVRMSPYTSSPQGGLFKWDLSSVPSDVIVDSASISFYVTDASANQFSLYDLRRDWGESSATWNSTGTTTWTTAGAASTTDDRYNANLWSGSFNTAGDVTLDLNADGEGVIQDWIDGTKTNYGLTVQNYSGGTGQDYWDVASKENTSNYTKPTLNITYCVASTDPTINTSGTLSAFTTTPGVASAEQSYIVTGANLTNSIVVTAPAGFQISTTAGTGFGSSLSLLPETGSVAATTVYVRLFSATQGSFAGNITHASTGATQKTLAVEGTVSNQVCYTDQEFVTSADLYMSAYNTTYNYGAQTYMRVTLGTSQQRGALVRWDLSSLPVGAVISNPRLQLYVSTAGSATYNLYNMRRAWVEGSGSGSATDDGATWATYDGTNAWGTNGAANTTSDRFDTNLWGAGSSSFSSTGSKTIALNSSGLGVVQGWVDGSLSNYGLTIQNYTTGSTDVQFSTKENTTAANRPRLILDYCVGDIETFALAITAAPSGSGSVTLMPSGGTYIVDSVVTMTPVPTTGYQFNSWGGANSGDIIDTAGVYTIVMNADKAITANFSLLPVPHAPDAPSLVAPADGATNVLLPPHLSVSVTDPDNDNMNISFYGREAGTQTPAEDFLFIAVPDTQNNAQSSNTVLQAQFAWIANRYTNPGTGDPDLVFVTHLGDLVNTSSVESQWVNIDAAFDQLDAAGVPYSVGPGNHDIATGTTYYTNYFGSARFTGKPWYGGYYTSGSDNYSNYSLFSTGGMDFIMINLQYNAGSGALDWADALLKANPDRRGIVEQHDILNVDNSWVNQAPYTALSDNPNLFLMLCGHMHSGSDGSAYRLETRTGMQSVHIVQTDYQDLTGQDFIRLLTFKPSSDQIYAQIFSPGTPGGYKTSESNFEQFTMSYEMEGEAGAPFELIGTASGIPSGSNAAINWADRAVNSEYEWYAVASDGSLSTTSSTWSFTTAGGAVNQPPVVSGIPDQTISEGATFLTVALDNYVADPDNTDAEMVWTYNGNTALTVSIVNRVATIGIPNLDWNGSETITFRATDPGSLFDEDSANFTVTAVNDAPVITAQAQVLTTPEDTALEILLTHLTVTDVDNVYPGDFTLTVLTGSNYTISGNTITPIPGFFGTLTVSVKVNDGQADSNIFNLTVTVTQGGVTPVLPSNFWGILRFAVGDEDEPDPGEILYAYLDSETTAITSVAIGSDGTSLTYAVNVPSYLDGTHPTTVTFKLANRVLAISEWQTGTNVELNLHPPKPDTGGPYVSLAAAGSIALSGAVTDWGNDVTTYNWDLDEDGAHDDSAVLNPTFNFSSAGTYTVSLKAVDGQGGEGYAASQVFALTLSGLTGQVYNGSPHPVTVSGVETPFAYAILYGEPGSPTPPTNAGTHKVLVQILSGSDVIAAYETSMVIAKATAIVTLGSLSHTYDGTVKAATATTTPTGLSVNFVYDPANPLNAGNYAVTATISDSNYEGTGSGTLVIAKATAIVTLGSLSHTYDGTVKAATATTTPTGLTVNFVYDPVNPLNAGSYAVTATIADSNYQGSNSGTLVIAKATATVTLSNLAQTYDGTAKAPTAVTTPVGLTVNFVYDPVNPLNAGSYAVTATISDPNYAGTTSGTLVIAKATATVTLSNLVQTYDGNPKPVTVTTTPTGLTVVVTYDGLSTAPSIAGSYAVVATVNDANYLGSASGTLVISGLSHSIDLLAGWNLASFNLTPTDPDIEDVLADILDDVILVYGWNGESGSWLRFDPALGFGNTLTELDESMGFWINMEVASTLTVLGTAPIITDITLYEGWNLIGWPSDASAALPAALAEIANNYDLIMAYHANDTADPWKLFDLDAPGYANDLTAMAPGWGYWINMTAADSLPIGH